MTLSVLISGHTEVPDYSNIYLLRLVLLMYLLKYNKLLYYLPVQALAIAVLISGHTEVPDYSNIYLLRLVLLVYLLKY